MGGSLVTTAERDSGPSTWVIVPAPHVAGRPGQHRLDGRVGTPVGLDLLLLAAAKRTLSPVAVETIVPEGTVSRRAVRLTITTWPAALADGLVAPAAWWAGWTSPATCTRMALAGRMPASVSSPESWMALSGDGDVDRLGGGHHGDLGGGEHGGQGQEHAAQERQQAQREQQVAPPGAGAAHEGAQERERAKAAGRAPGKEAGRRRRRGLGGANRHAQPGADGAQAAPAGALGARLAAEGADAEAFGSGAQAGVGGDQGQAVSAGGRLAAQGAQVDEA